MNAKLNIDSTLLVWDLEDLPICSHPSTILWRHSSDGLNNTSLSIAACVESQAHELRKSYLSWVYELPEVIVGSKRILDHLQIRPLLSYWWLTKPAQKFNITNGNGINDTLKLLAFESILASRQATKVELHTENSALALCMEELCYLYSNEFHWVNKRFQVPLRIPYILRSLFKGLGYLLWYSLQTLKCRRIREPGKILGQVLFIDILVHLDPFFRKEGRFKSNYWTSLVDKMKSWRLGSTWIHLFYMHDELKAPVKASDLMKVFNKNSNEDETHFLLEDYFDFDIIKRALIDYANLIRVAHSLSAFKAPSMMNSRLKPWPLHRTAWIDSLIGVEAMLNCLRLALFEKVMLSIPPQRIGIYIAENQPWEIALMYAWRSAGHGTLIGVPHTSVRFWDLRYHHDSRIYKQEDNKLKMPMPDIMAINGPLARSALLDGGFPENRLRNVEALRFLHLQTRNEHICRKQNDSSCLRILICGDFDVETNNRMLLWINTALSELSTPNLVVIKPHPAFPIDTSKLAHSFTVSTRPIHELFSSCDVVFTSSTTSAAADALCAGVPVIQMLDGRNFDLSPLRCTNMIQTVDSPKKLAHALLQAKAVNIEPATLFNIDTELIGWQHLFYELKTLC